MLRPEVVNDFAKLAELAPAWRELVAAADASFTMTPTWLSTWWANMRDAKVEPFGKRELACVLVRDGDGRLVGMAPFTKRWAGVAGIPRVRLEALGTGEPKEDEVCSDYVSVLAAPAHREAVADAVVDALVGGRTDRWDEIVWPFMRRDDPMLDTLTRAFVGRGQDVRLEPGGAAGVAKLPATYQAYLAGLHRTHRYTVRRAMNDFESWAKSVGGYTFERVRSEADLPAGVETLVALHAARWGERNVFSSARFRAFHDEVMRAMLRGVDGRVDLWCLTAGGRPIAALYNIMWRGVVYFYQGGRVTDVPKGIKPGFVANVLALQAAIEEGLREYDFLPGNARYKAQLGNMTRPVATLRVQRNDARAVGLDLLSGLVRGAAMAFERRREATR